MPHIDSRILTVYVPWLAALICGTLEAEAVHKLRRAFFGVTPPSVGARWLLLIFAGLGLALTLGEGLALLGGLVHGLDMSWLPGTVYIVHMTILAKSARCAGTCERDPSANQEV